MPACDPPGGHGSFLLGREPELALLDQFLARIPDHGASLVLRGDPGIGKTALLSAAAETAGSLGLTVLRTAGAPTETGMAFAGLHQLLRPLLAGLADLPEPHSAALSAALGVTDALAPDPFLIALAALNLLATAAEREPLLLIVDQAEWLDAATMRVLLFVARRLDADRIAILIAARDSPAAPLDGAALPELRLGGLNNQAASELLRVAAPDLGARQRRRVLQVAAGNPLALLELPVALRRSATGEDGLLSGGLSLTARLERAFAEQASGLPAPTRDLLLLAAADERASVPELLSAASRLSGSEASLAALDQAQAAGLAGLADGSIAFRHPLARSATYQAATADRRRQAHSALAAAITGEPDRRLWHVAAATAGPDETVAGNVELLSVRLARRGAIGPAMAAARRAAALSADAPRRCSRFLRAAELAAEAGEPEMLLQLADEAERLSPDSEQRARLTWLRSTFADGARDDPGQTGSLIDAAGDAAAAGNSELALHLLFGAAVRCWRSDHGERSAERVADAVERIPVPKTNPRRVATLAMTGPVRRGRDVSERLTAIEASAATLTAQEEYLTGLAARAIGDHDVAARFLGSATAQLRAEGRLGVLVQVLVMRAWVAIAQGNWPSADILVDESDRLAQEAGQSWWQTGSLIARAILCALRGDTGVAERLVDDAEKAALAQGLNDLQCMIAFTRGVIWLGAGRPAEALEHLTRAFDRSDPAFHEAARFMTITYLADAAAQSGQRHVVAPILEELEQLSQHTPSPALQAGLVYARPVLARDDEAERLYEVALKGDHLRQQPFDTARLNLAYGAWLRRQRRVSQSRAPLRKARQTFDALACVPWAERARQELRASGEQSRDRVPGARDQLSAQELQIAQLAAAGLTNPEIAQRLYLSRRTVSSHLYRLFPKLGITSRSQLASAIDVPAEVLPSAAGKLGARNRIRGEPGLGKSADDR
jgi:DNA-binding CsgD family transcriptional regulator